MFGDCDVLGEFCFDVSGFVVWFGDVDGDGVGVVFVVGFGY